MKISDPFFVLTLCLKCVIYSTMENIDNIIAEYKSGKTISQLNKIYGIPRKTITKILIDGKVLMRPEGLFTDSDGIDKTEIKISKDALYQMRVVDAKSYSQIAKETGLSVWLVEDRCKYYGFPGQVYRHAYNYREVPSKDVLYDLYHNKLQSQSDIARTYKTTPSTVKKWLVKNDIQLRAHKEVIGKAMKKYADDFKEVNGYYPQADPELVKRSLQTRLDRFGTTFIQRDPNKEYTEDKVRNYLNSIGGNFVKSDYSILGNKELDMVDHDKKIAVEYCGLYWHHELTRCNDVYHWEKYKKCQEKGYRLITIFEDEWLLKQNQVKNFLFSIVGTSEVVYARKCAIKQLEKYQANKFFEDNHIQGEANSILYAYGLEYNGQLIGVISFGLHHRNNDKSIIVLNRLAFVHGITVIGGASRLLQAFVKEYGSKYKKIISWSDNRWSTGNVYEKLGFIKEVEYKRDYSYFVEGTKQLRFPKQSMTRKALGCKPGETEHQKALELGYLRVWDCGKIRWTYNLV